MPVADFLGRYIPPAKLTRAALLGVSDRKQGHFAAVIANATIANRAAKGKAVAP